MPHETKPPIPQRRMFLSDLHLSLLAEHTTATTKHSTIMKKILFFKFIVLALLLCACSKEVNEPTLQGAKTDNPINRTADISLLIDETDAYQNIIGFMEMLESDGEEFSPEQREVINIDRIPGEFLIPYLQELNIDISSSELPESILYIFNFRQGYAVAAADKRLPEAVYCLTEKGNANVNDFQFQPPVIVPGIQFNELGEENDIEAVIDRNRNIPIPAVNLVMYSVATGFRPEYFHETGSFSYHWSDSTSVSLIENTPKYGQGRPLNRYAPIINGFICPAGCGNVAALITMVYNGLPTSINNYTAPREELMEFSSANSEDVLAHWVRIIGETSLSTYTQDGTTTNIYLLSLAMRSLGFYLSTRNQYSRQDVYSMIQNNKPVILLGQSGSGGHYFVVEKAKLQLRKKYRIVNGIEIFQSNNRVRQIIKCNMGWYGISDGWYIQPEYISTAQENGNSLDSVNTLSYYQHLTMLNY